MPVLTDQAGGPIYGAPSMPVTFDVSFEGAGISGIEWRQNGVKLDLPRIGYEATIDSDFTEASLTIQQYEPSLHSGKYEFLVMTPTGKAILAEWELKDAGNCTTISH